MTSLLSPRQRMIRANRWLWLALAVVAALAITRTLADTPDLTSSGTFGAALRLGTPIFLAGLGGVYAERVGVVNIGLEGMMILGTWFGAWAGWLWGPWIGLAVGVLAGALGGLLHALATVTFNVDHIVSGVAINILAFGGMRFLSVVTYGAETGGGATQSPSISDVIGKASVPVLSGGEILGWESPDLLGTLESQRWFFISDLAGLAKGMTVDVSWAVIVAVALVPATWWFLWKTPLGLRMRSVGEHPVAAESLGVNVYRMKYLGVMMSGGMAGLGGAILVTEFARIYREGQTGGRGFIGLASMIMGNWRPGGAAAAGGLFGFTFALELRDEPAVHALLLMIALAGVASGVWMGYRRRWAPAVWLVGTGIAALAVFMSTDSIPREFVFIAPYVTTLVVMSLASQHLRMPAADGRPYRRGQQL
ncbi:MAG: ABC transporter permease [bacterium]|nr:ABC transporter permease [bacterium]